MGSGGAGSVTSGNEGDSKANPFVCLCAGERDSLEVGRLPFAFSFGVFRLNRPIVTRDGSIGSVVHRTVTAYTDRELTPARTDTVVVVVVVVVA